MLGLIGVQELLSMLQVGFWFPCALMGWVPFPLDQVLAATTGGVVGKDLLNLKLLVVPAGKYWWPGGWGLPFEFLQTGDVEHVMETCSHA